MQSQEQEFRPDPDRVTEQLDYPAQPDITPRPDPDLSNHRPTHKLQGKVALITGGDSGIGRAVAIAFALEGANVTIVYTANDDDAQATQAMVEETGQQCLLIKSDIRDIQACQTAIEQTVLNFGHLNVLVNNVNYQMYQAQVEDITEEQFRCTLETNLFGCFYMAKAAVPYLQAGDVIINTGSIVGKIGNEFLIDYAASQGAVHSFTKALALNLAERQIRVNAVVPGSICTPDNPASGLANGLGADPVATSATMPAALAEEFDPDTALKRAAQPEELAPAYVFLASQDSSFVTGALLDVTGGQLAS